MLRRLRDLDYIDEAAVRAGAWTRPLRVHARAEGIRHPRRVRGRAGAPGGVRAVRGRVVHARHQGHHHHRSQADQEAAYDSVRRNVLAYDARHGYRGPEALHRPAGDDTEEREEAIVEALQKRPSSDGLMPAVVLVAARANR